ncbi:M23 family metallopeptidase [Streptomyces kronopolitis]|uniref:M23 family metallopeptidase n=1 Tax=Streptomyces kronopolitis TaxID=1612435 RepID=UPI0034413C4F
MFRLTAIRNSKKSILRNPIVPAVGVGVTAALGAGVAMAIDSGPSGRPSAVTSQADPQARASIEAKQAAARKAGDWATPVDGYTLGSPFGRAGSRWSSGHSGQDFVVPSGTPVKAAYAGTVVKAGLNSDGPAYGKAIVIKHDNGKYTQYAHLSSAQVQVGQQVSTDQKIGLAGSTGNSTGPHLHFEVRTGPSYGTGTEPTGFLRSRGASV